MTATFSQTLQTALTGLVTDVGSFLGVGIVAVLGLVSALIGLSFVVRIIYRRIGGTRV